MTLIEKRKQTLLLHLSQQEDYVTAKELARVLNVSDKTIYRLVKELNDETAEGELIYSERGRGYKLNYKSYVEGRYRVSQRTNYSPVERRNNVMEELLFSSPIARNIYDLYEEYYVSDTVVVSDEKVIAQNFTKYHLKLERKKNRIRVLGEEANIRRAIKDLIQATRMINIDELNIAQKGNINRYDAEFVLNQLKLLEKMLQGTIPYPYNVNIFSHLYILLSRFRSVGNSFLKQVESIEPLEVEEMQQVPVLYEAAKKVIENTEKYLSEELPEVEVYYLFQYLESSRMQTEVDDVENFSEEVKEITDLYVTEMSKQLNIPFDETELFNELAKHIKPLLNRLEHGIRIKNTLLEQIKLEYTKTFSKVEKVSKLAAKKHELPEITEDENGFLALYFAQAIESYPQKIKTLIMCTTGVGTSELLKVKVTNKFPEIEILDVVATRDVQNVLEKYPDTELVITTVLMRKEIEKPSLLVNAMFTRDDQERLQRLIKELKYEE